MGAPSLRARTLELLWHCREIGEELEQLGMPGATPAEGITSIDYDPLHHRLATTGGDQCIRLWQLNTAAIDEWLADPGKDMASCSRHVCKMTTMWMPLTARWSPRGTMLASGHCEGKICLWWNATPPGSHPIGNEEGMESPCEEWKDYRHLIGHVSDVYDLVFSPDARYIFSGASDGSIAIHDLEGGTMAVFFLQNPHGKFCCGVAWDPWGRYLHSFGACPALQCYTNVPARRSGDRIHLASQRRCQGGFLGEPDALAFRRIGWSPDGLFLAVPFGKVTKDAPAATTTARQEGEKRTLSDAIDAKLAAERARQIPNEIPVVDEGIYENEEEVVVMVEAENDGCKGSPAENRRIAPEARKPQSEDKKKTPRVDPLAQNDNEEEKDMMHCVNIYLRNAPDKLAARLVIRGYNELRGVLWAPYFFEPLPHKDPLPLVLETPLKAADAGLFPFADGLQNGNPFHANPLKAPDPKAQDPGAAVGAESQTSDASSADNPFGSWGPADYRMALAVWTCDSLLIYTTDSCVRHSDFTDLHARSITDVCWGQNARFIYTASLDGYVSVIGFGSSLTLAHRLPVFSNRPVTIALTKMLRRIQKSSEAERSHKTAGGGEHRQGANEGDTTVAVVRKKKKIEAAEPTPRAAISEISLDQHL
ncbi:unnamed protein product [Phytomonas sp. EM1]|nr:unnamed protein product [Phytomonas sp. EM1]|eukprot:CCW60110.1 unnamed protein product [Phytomonas sp. isolate EM1]